MAYAPRDRSIGGGGSACVYLYVVKVLQPLDAFFGNVYIDSNARPRVSSSDKTGIGILPQKGTSGGCKC